MAYRLGRGLTQHSGVWKAESSRKGNVHMPWQQARVLIIGKNYPVLSKAHAEVSCTGGLLAPENRLIRLYPVPYRLLADEQRFGNFQWIEARIMRKADDPRPESFRVEPQSIVLRESVTAQDVAGRRRAIDDCPAHVASVEALQVLQAAHGTSLGIVRPKRITGVRVRLRSDDEVTEWVEREEALRQQGVLFEEVKPPRLDPPTAEFLVGWVCDVADCPGHEMALHQWGIHQLWRKLEGDPDRSQKVEDLMRARLDVRRYDVFLFLGNYSYRPGQFGLMEIVPLKKGAGQDDGPTLFG
jgi:hypothetical protein